MDNFSKYDLIKTAQLSIISSNNFTIFVYSTAIKTTRLYFTKKISINFTSYAGEILS